MLYLASRPRPRAIFHVVHSGRYFNWFIVLTFEFCAFYWRDMAFCEFCLQLIANPSQLAMTCSILYPVLYEFSYSTVHTLTVLYEK